MIQVTKKPFGDIPQFSERDKAYTLSDKRLLPFAKYEVSLAAFEQVMADRKEFPVNRSLLVEVFKKQYSTFSSFTPEQQQLVDQLASENTFTIITAHQPSLFTGPLYFIYKIISAINLSRHLKEKYPSNNFVPVFISGGEDHDFDEINHLKIFNRKYTWEGVSTGPVGKMETDSLQSVLQEIIDVLGDQPNAKHLSQLLQKHYGSDLTYGNATLSFVNELLGKYGLLVLNMDQPDLKRSFIPHIKKEIFEQASAALVNETQDALSNVGFKSQAHARDINFFYMKKGIRERVVQEGEVYKVLNTELSFSRHEMENLIDTSPECFSPNVVMRPLFQEFTLPNLAYIGGGGELAYWLERKTQFQAFNVFYPMLVRRNSCLWIDKGTNKKLKKFDLSTDRIFYHRDAIVKGYVKNQATAKLDFSVGLKTIEDQVDKFIDTADQVDPTLAKSFQGEKVRLLKQLDQMTNRITRAEKQKHEVAIAQIEKLKEKLFPKNGLQERTDNFMPFYVKHGESYFELLLQHLNPLEKEFIIFSEES